MASCFPFLATAGSCNTLSWFIGVTASATAMCAAISSLFWESLHSRASCRSLITGRNVNSRNDCPMDFPQQNTDQLNNAILAWTHELAPHGIVTTDQDLRIT